MNKLTLSLIALNIVLLTGLAFYLLNKNCAFCQREMSFKRIFTFKNECQACAEGKDE